MNVFDIETPAVLIDLNRMQNNITRMQAHCTAQGVALRPHIKTHKIPHIARMQLDAGAQGIACQKLSEAEVFAEAGFNDILIPYNIVGEQKARRLVDLALYNRVTVSVDHLMIAAGLARAAKEEDIAIRILVDIATSIERTGTTPEEAVTLAKYIDAEAHLHFAGVLLYPSDEATRPLLQETLSLLNAAGLGVDIVSGGGTGGAWNAADVPEVTEVRAGTYVFNDMQCVSKNWATLDDCALMVAATVVSRPTDERVILDAGSKTISSDTSNGGHGLIVEYPEAYIYKLSEEHAHCDFSQVRDRPSIGERVHIIPAHACVVMNLHDQVYATVDSSVEEIWQVAARGRVW